MSGAWSVGLIRARALINNLFEEKSTECEDAEDGPDFERRLGLWRGDVRGGFVGAGGLAGLAEAREGGGGGGEEARRGAEEGGVDGGAAREGVQCARHGEVCSMTMRVVVMQAGGFESD